MGSLSCHCVTHVNNDISSKCYSPPVSRITAEPEWLEPNEEDDGKYALMIDKHTV